ncbi:hypothetical protein PZH32_12150, partial [Adlercreutzia equolifaciens]|nr:hypothetical protein [Adlercreutzia equolifaciens]
MDDQRKSENACMPALRFEGFTDPWEQRKLGEMYARSSEKNDGTIKGDRIISVATMKFNPEQRFSGKDYLQTYNIMRLGDIAFEGHHSKDFMYGRFV